MHVVETGCRAPVLVLVLWAGCAHGGDRVPVPVLGAARGGDRVPGAGAGCWVPVLGAWPHELMHATSYGVVA